MKLILYKSNSATWLKIKGAFIAILSSGKTAPLARRAKSNAFTLLEVILAMTLVTMIVLMIANMFQEVSFSWTIGTQSAEMNTAGRAAVDFIAQELSQAVAGPIEANDPPDHAIRFQLLNGNELLFVTLAGDPQGDPQSGRALRSALFKHEDDKQIIKYGRHPESFNPYKDDPKWDSAQAQMLVANVVDLQFYAYASVEDLKKNNFTLPPYDLEQLPVAVDVYLTVLGNEDALKAANLGRPEREKFVARNARRYTSRAYFNNRHSSKSQ